ncbi:MAG: 23S rRNA (guanosine(2251)-2'-O)-methyltransferase RlmB [Alphaproteobacteria bacterium]|nr:MAG: 23S rRNA (guanosine(2251)-2'-O)-methyltransferase RlmB [Alphaproteobacteria bacterium]
MSKTRNNRPAPDRRAAPAPKRGTESGRQQAGRGDRPQRPPRDRTGLTPVARDGFFLFGRHAVEAALKNPARECVRLVGLEKPLAASGLKSIRPNLRVDIVADEDMLRSAVPSDSPHQGVLLEVRPLPGHALEDLAPVAGRKNILLMLDQVTDPHNVGACLRSAAAFGARALITQDRHSPGESGTLARASSGGLEVTPWLRVVNLAQALDTLKDMGYWHVGLDGDTETAIRDVGLGDNIVIVMGSEGSGLRPLTRKHCDAIARIPMTGMVESLNVSNAAAIALYEFTGLGA